jgi:hypothetical protein
MEKPFEDLYTVIPERLLAGEYPGSFNSDRAHQKVRWLLQAGVDFFVDLTEEGELKPYEAIVHKEAGVNGLPAQHHRLPIRDLDIPSPGEMTCILDTIDDALESDHTVYVHCWGGIGRTGTVIGCYLARHGLDGESALERLAWLRRETSDGGRASPETPAQKQMIREWATGS